VKKRLLLLVPLGLALFLWQGGLSLFPVERTITWHLWGDFRSIRRAELQLYRGEELFKREQLEFPHGAMSEPSSKLSLKGGTYRALMMIWRDGNDAEVKDILFVVDSSATHFTIP
jgi:hypothetical protein